jgi:hypothetical protein
MRRCECIGSACRIGDEVAFTPWHADPLAFPVLAKTRRAILDTPLAPRQAALTRGEGSAEPRSDPPPGDHLDEPSDRTLSALTTIPAPETPQRQRSAHPHRADAVIDAQGPSGPTRGRGAGRRPGARFACRGGSLPGVLVNRVGI